MAAKLADKLPIVTFAQLPFVEYATISPDGTHWAGLFAIGGVQTIAVLSLFDKAEKPARVSLPDRTNARTLRWVNDDNVIVGLDALESIEGDDWYISRTVAINRVTGKVTKLIWNVGGQNASDVIWLPNDTSNEVLISAQNSIYLGDEYWPAVHRVDVTNGHDRVLVNGQTDVSTWAADGEGNVRVGVGYNDDSRRARLV